MGQEHAPKQVNVLRLHLGGLLRLSDLHRHHPKLLAWRDRIELYRLLPRGLLVRSLVVPAVGKTCCSTNGQFPWCWTSVCLGFLLWGFSLDLGRLRAAFPLSTQAPQPCAGH